MTLGVVVEYRKHASAEVPQDMLEDLSIRIDDI